ncbi:hypothetical protein KM043_002270 [Ampulex compressa]|nr:hypothetical protein KM043_002270 [Ampulex compressa]
MPRGRDFKFQFKNLYLPLPPLPGERNGGIGLRALVSRMEFNQARPGPVVPVDVPRGRENGSSAPVAA